MMASGFTFSEASKNRLATVDKRLQEIAALAITISKYDFGIPKDGGLRTAEEQNRLFRAGASKADGYDKLSKHQSGKALDVYAHVNGQASWEPQHLAYIACAFFAAANKLGYRIQWGGLWRTFPDLPHFELAE